MRKFLTRVVLQATLAALAAAFAMPAFGQYRVRDPYRHIGNSYAPRGYERLSPVERANVYREQQRTLTVADLPPAPPLPPLTARETANIYRESPPPPDIADLPPAVPPPPPGGPRTNRATTRTTVPPRATPTAAREEPVQPTLEDRAAAESEKVHAVSEQLREHVRLLRERVHEAITVQGKAPRLDLLEEGKRHRLFTQYVGDTVIVGRRAIAQEAKFRQVFEAYLRVNKGGGGVFREAEAHFHKRSLEANSRKVKALNDRISKWYSAKALIGETAAKVAYPTDWRAKLGEVEEMVSACDELHRWLLKDEHFFTEAEVQADLALFFEAFNDINAVLDTWTSMLLQGLNEQEQKEPAPPETGPSRAPGREATPAEQSRTASAR